MKGHFEETALPHREHLRHARDRPGVEHAVAHDAKAPDPFRDQDVAVRKKGQTPGILQSSYERNDANGVCKGLERLRRFREREWRHARKRRTTLCWSAGRGAL